MRYLSALLLSLCFTATPVLVGCDRTISHDQSTSTDSNGTTVQKDTTVKQDSNGNIVKDQTKTVDKP
ncbi:MAG: hypothetical protein M3O30_16090 [Planctomycetota bacterium]|nr:hypothetical protein [Planctomycetota bacterium]